MNELADETTGRGHVLVVDDEADVLATLRRQLRREFNVYTAESADQGYAILGEQPIQVIISDQRMPRITGSEFLARVKDSHPRAIRMMLTGYADLQAVIDAVNSGEIFRYITKPWDPLEITTVVREAYEHYRLLAENERLIEALRDANADLERKVLARTRELSESENRYRTIVDGTSDPIMLVGLDNRINAINPAFTRVTGYEADEVLGHTTDMLSSGRHSPSFFDEMRAALRDAGRWRGLIWNRRKDGGVYVQRLAIARVGEASKNTGQYVCVFTDPAEDADQLDQVWTNAQHDPLTGLPNRILLTDRMQSILLRSERHGGVHAVLFADLDGFKPVNDDHGHAIGDELLQAVAERLRGSVRKSDTVARIGGDEFVLFLTDIENRERAMESVQRLADIVCQPVPTSIGAVSVAASIGIAVYPDDGHAVAELLERADRAMYEEKHAHHERSPG